MMLIFNSLKERTQLPPGTEWLTMCEMDHGNRTGVCF